MKFSRSQHLRLNSDFESIREKSAGCVCGAFRMRIKFTGFGIRRLGVISSKRVGCAVRRNRARRLLREAFRNCQDMLPQSCDMLLIASRSLPDMNGDEVRELFALQAGKILSRFKPHDNVANAE